MSRYDKGCTKGEIMDEVMAYKWVNFYMPIPKSATKKQLREIEKHPKHYRKPDIDNLLKFSLDCLNGELFKDDSLIWSLNALKGYHTEPGTYIMATW
jgi:Holliday junction resolvase RusA-like endonuclease